LVARLRRYFRDFGFKVIRLKYFIMIVVALLLEILTLTLYLLKLQNIVKFELFNLAILYGAISGIIAVLAAGILILMKVDRKKDAEKIKSFRDFQKNYSNLSTRHLNNINGLVRAFENETVNLDSKLDYAQSLEEKYSSFLDDLSGLDVPVFLSLAHRNECEHLDKEKQFYAGFSTLMQPQELKSISNESEMLHDNFLREMHSIEKGLRLIV
jgi:uncharacterized integral membrane protein